MLTPSSKLSTVAVASESELLVHIDGQLHNMPERGLSLKTLNRRLRPINSIDARYAIKAVDITAQLIDR